MNHSKNRCSASLSLGLLLAGRLWAQSAPQPLQPPPLTPTHQDYVAALAALQGQTPSGSQVAKPPSSPPRSSTSQITGTITSGPGPVIVEKSLPLTPREAEALRLAHLA